MRKNTSRFLKLVVSISCMLCLILSVVAYAAPKIPTATSDFYVNDFAQIFSEKEKSELMANALNLAIEHNGIQVVVTTVETLDGYTVEDYATKMYNQYGIGKNDMGVLLLVATEDRQIRMEVGIAMEEYISNSKAASFLDDYAIPYLRDNKFSEGMISLQEAVIDYIVTHVSANKEVKVFESASADEVNGIGRVPVDEANTINKEPNNKVNVSNKVPINNVNSNATKTDNITEESNGKGGNNIFMIAMIIVLILVICGAIGIIIANVGSRRALQEEIEFLKASASEAEAQHAREKENLLQQTSAFEKVRDTLNTKCNKLENELASLNEKYKRAKTLHPDLDGEIDEMVREEIRQKDMEAAKNVDEIIQSALKMPVDKDHVCEFAEAINAYSRLTDSQKSYMTSDIEVLNENHRIASELAEEYRRKCEEERARNEANDAEVSITSIINCIFHGDANNISSLNRAQSIYDNMSYGAKAYFDSAIFERLGFLLVQARDDVARIEREEAERRRRMREEEERRRRMREEEERRRRMREDEARRRRNSVSRPSNLSSRPGGMGGRSRGGGASRGF